MENPAKDFKSVSVGVLVVGILVFLAWKCTLLGSSLNHHRQVIYDRDLRWQQIFVQVQSELTAALSMGRDIQQQLKENRQIGRDNSATLKSTEERLLEIEREIKRLHP